MIDHILIKDFGLIKETQIDFGQGLNIITGETGSGKSMVIETISLCLGARADSSLIRKGCSKSIIQLVGTFNGEEIIISREITSKGKSLCKINGNIVTLSQLVNLTKSFIDIHGQYDNQSLLNEENHIDILDGYGKEEILPLLDDYKISYEKYIEACKKLKDLEEKVIATRNQEEFYQYQLNEITHLNPKLNEDSILEEELNILKNTEIIYSGANKAYTLINSEKGILTRLKVALKALENISSYGETFADSIDVLDNCYYEIEEVGRKLSNYTNRLSFSSEDIDKKNDRLYRLEQLKKKYGGSLENVIRYKDELMGKIEDSQNFDFYKEELEATKKKLWMEVDNLSKKIREKRILFSRRLSEEINEELTQLNFANGQMEINVIKQANVNSKGIDKVEFLISTNLGESAKPMAKIASGGEISRIMLAIKKITSKTDNISTLIFDEIDTGISGKTAAIVGKKLKSLAKDKQIICITHLPQIAALGDENFRITKEVEEDSTITKVVHLENSKEKEVEIARLLGGENITEVAINNARELING